MTEHPDALTLTAWTEGQLPAAERDRVARHVADCPDCRAQTAEQEQTNRLLSRLPAETAPAGLGQGILAAVRRKQAADRRREAELRRGERIWQRVAAASVVCALAGLALVAAAWPDVLNVAAAAAGVSVPQTSLTGLVDVPLETWGQIASSAVDWATVLTQGAGAALLLGLVLLTAGAFGGLAELVHTGRKFVNGHPA
jgi:anti-sigma factor RsiW